MSYRPLAGIDPLEAVEATTALWQAAHKTAAVRVVEMTEAQTEQRPTRFYVERAGALFRVDITPTDRVAVR